MSLFRVGEAGWGDELLWGFATTIALAIATLPIGLMFGFATVAAALSGSAILRAMATAYITVFRGLPELLTIFFIYNGFALLLTRLARWLDPGAGFVDLPPFAAGALALGLVFGAYAAEVLRGAFQSLDPGQQEAGLAIGMTRRQLFWRIKLPQIWRFALPGFGNLWVNLVKDTSLVSIIALNDVMRAGNVAVAATKQPFIVYLAVCLLYWSACLVSEAVLDRMELSANRGMRRAAA